METTALILIIITLFLLIIIVGLLTLLLFKLLRQPPLIADELRATDKSSRPDISNSEFHPAILERIQEMQKDNLLRVNTFCTNHTDEPGEVTCAICDNLFCRSCVKPFKSLHFCNNHLPLIMRSEWIEVFTLKTSTQYPENGVTLYAEKKKLFEEKNIPTYIETHYKINVDQDFIETFLVVFSMEEHQTIVKNFLEK